MLSFFKKKVKRFDITEEGVNILNGENGIKKDDTKLDSYACNIHYKVGELMGVAKALSAVLPTEYKTLADLLLNTANNVKDPVLSLLKTGTPLEYINNELIQKQLATNVVENTIEETFEKEKSPIVENVAPIEAYTEPIVNDFAPKISDATPVETDSPAVDTNNDTMVTENTLPIEDDFSTVDEEPTGHNLLGEEQKFDAPVSDRENPYIEPQTLQTTITEDVNNTYRNIFAAQGDLQVSGTDLGVHMPAKKVLEANQVDASQLKTKDLPVDERSIYDLNEPVIDEKTGEVDAEATVAPYAVAQTEDAPLNAVDENPTYVEPTTAYETVETAEEVGAQDETSDAAVAQNDVEQVNEMVDETVNNDFEPVVNEQEEDVVSQQDELEFGAVSGMDGVLLADEVPADLAGTSFDVPDTEMPQNPTEFYEDAVLEGPFENDIELTDEDWMKQEQDATENPIPVTEDK